MDGEMTAGPGEARRRPSRYGRLQRNLVLSFVLVGLAMVGLAAWSIVNDYQRRIDEGRAQTQVLVHALNGQVEALLAGNEITLREVVKKIAQEGGVRALDRQQLSALLAAEARLFPSAPVMFVFDPEGELLANSRDPSLRLPKTPGAECLSRLRAQPEDRLCIGKPVKSPVSGKWRITIGLPLLGRQGQFEGVLGMGLDPEYFESFYRSLSLGDEVTLVLTRSDGLLLVRYPWMESMPGRDVSQSEVFTRGLPKASSGTLRTKALLDGRERIVSYLRVERFPLVVSASILDDALLMSWQVDTAAKCAFVLFALAGIAVLLVVSLRQIRRLEANEADLVFNKFSTDRSAEMVFWLERDGRFYYVNNAMCERTGYRKEELLARTVFDLCPDIHPRVWQRAVLDLGKLGARRLSQFAVTKYGEKFAVDAVASIVEYSGRALVCVNARDETAQRAAEGALRESESRYRSTVDSLHEGIMVRDRERILACNPSAERIFGLPAERIVDRLALAPLVKFFDEDGNLVEAGAGPAYRALHSGKPQYGYTYRVQRPDGSSLWVEANAVPLFRPGETVPYRVVATYADITERRNAELALHTSRERFRSMVNSLHEGVLVRDRDGTIVECNPALERMLRVPREVIMGQRLLTAAAHVRHPDGSLMPPEERAWMRALHTGQGQFGVVYQLLRNDGSQLWVSSNAEPIFSEGTAQPVGVVTSHTDISTRREAEIALRASEEKFARVFDLIPELVTVTDVDTGYYVDMNDAWTPFTGFTREEAIGRTSIELGIWVQAADRRRLVEDVNAHGEVRDREVSFRRKDGGIFYCTAAACVFEVQGRRLLMMIVRDVTQQKFAEEERRAAEERLRQSEERFDIAARNAEVGIWDWRLDEDRIHVSDVSRRLMGFAPGEASDTRSEMLARIHPDDRARATGELLESVKRRSALDIEYRVTLPGGTRWLRVQGRASYGSDGRAHRYTGSLQDITERKQVEVALVESESKFREIFETSLDPIWIARVAGDGRIEYEDWNHAQVKAVGKRAQDVRGKTPHEIYPRWAADIILRRWNDCISAGVPMSWEERWPLAGGNRVWFSSVVPLRDANGRVFRLAGIARDLTDRIAAEESIRRLNEELEQRVAERTRELEIANKELEAFSYSVSHDLRAPLRAIEGFSALLAQSPPSATDAAVEAKTRDYLPRIRAAALRMGRLIDDMLNLSRVGRHQLSRERFDLAGLAREVCEEIRAGDVTRSVRFEVEGDLQVEGDASLLRIAFTNLIGNAWKFSAPKSDARIKVHGQRGAQSVSIAVSDNGVGFDPAYSARLFGAFQRLHNEKEFAGSGIGLAIVQRIVHRHGGEITAIGKPGEGATFVLTLPLGRVASPETQS